jgi:hypothetical protein
MKKIFLLASAVLIVVMTLPNLGIAQEAGKKPTDKKPASAKPVDKKTALKDSLQTAATKAVSDSLQAVREKAVQDSVAAERARKAALPKEYVTVSLNLYGFNWPIQVEKGLAFNEEQLDIPNPRFASAITDAMEKMRPVAKQIAFRCEISDLEDWERFKAAELLTSQLYTSEVDRALATCGLLREMGYNASVFRSYDDPAIKLIIAIKQKVYQKYCFDVDGTSFYLFDTAQLSFKPSNATDVEGYLFEADKFLGVTTRPLSLERINLPLFPYASVRKVLRWDVDQKPFQLEVRQNKNLLDFMNDLPQVDLQLYLNAPVGIQFIRYVATPLQAELKKRDLKGTAAVNFLLNFCTQAFTYRKDITEKFNFAEETLLAEFSDCEDRAILLNALVRGLLGYNTIALKFENPGHISLAVELSDPPVASAIYEYQGKKYVLCDPSTKNASVGFLPEPLKNKVPEIVGTSKIRTDSREVEN